MIYRKYLPVTCWYGKSMGRCLVGDAPNAKQQQERCSFAKITE